MKTKLISLATTAAATFYAGAALAQSKPPVPAVPEIDLFSGTAAIAVLAAAVAFLWERSRSRA